MVAVIPDIETQEDLSPKHWDETRNQSVFQTEERGMDRRCDCQIALENSAIGANCTKSEIPLRAMFCL